MSRPRKNPRHITGTIARTTLEEKILRKLEKCDSDLAEVIEFKEIVECKFQHFEDSFKRMTQQIQDLAKKIDHVNKLDEKVRNLEKQVIKRINDNIAETNAKITKLEDSITKQFNNRIQKLDLRIATVDWSLRADVERMEESLIGLPMLRSSLENQRKFTENRLQVVNNELKQLKADIRAGLKKLQENNSCSTNMTGGLSPGWTCKIRVNSGNSAVWSQVVGDRDLAHICSIIASEYYRIGLELGLSTEMLSRCSAKSRDDNYRKTIEMLKLWKMKESKNATWGRLQTALIKLDLTDMVTALKDRFPQGDKDTEHSS